MTTSEQLNEARAMAFRIKTLSNAAAYIAREANVNDALEKIDMLSCIAESTAYFTEILQDKLDKIQTQATKAA